MKKCRNLILFIIVCIFLFIGVSFAAEDKTCTAVNLNELRTMAANVRVSYIPNEIETEGDISGEFADSRRVKKVLDIKIYNITSKLYIKVVSEGEDVTRDEHIITLADVGPDKSATIRQTAQRVPVTYTFTIYSDAYGCSTKTLRTFKMTLPRFNFYSELDVCQDIPEYYLCQPYTTFLVDGETFYDKVEEYKSKLEHTNENSEGIISEGTGVVSETITAFSKNKYIIVGIIVAVGVIATILLLRKRRNA